MTGTTDSILLTENMFIGYSYIDDNGNTYFANKYWQRAWKQITHKVRQSANWHCEECGVNLIHKPFLLHTHHVNNDIRDNRKENLQSLCIACHSQKDGEGHDMLYPHKRIARERNRK